MAVAFLPFVHPARAALLDVALLGLLHVLALLVLVRTARAVIAYRRAGRVLRRLDDQIATWRAVSSGHALGVMAAAGASSPDDVGRALGSLARLVRLERRRRLVLDLLKGHKR